MTIFRIPMFRCIRIILLLSSISLLGCDVDLGNYEIINLGGDCQIAYQMHINGLRKYALPFDKIICSPDSLMKILHNDFDAWLEKDKLEFVITERSKYILDTIYQTRWLHDFKLTEQFLEEYDDIYQTYQRRIQRFRTLVGEQNAVAFLRKNITKDEALALRDLLAGLYHHLNFVLVVLESTPDFKEDWHEERIINLFLKKPIPYHWKGDNQAWIEIFKVLGFVTSTQEYSTSEV